MNCAPTIFSYTLIEGLFYNKSQAGEYPRTLRE
jgi:hypothetical protein